MKLLSIEEFKELVLKLNALVIEADPDSAMSGLTMVACAFGMVLDTYAKPNPDNPQGMCDSPEAFRKHFAILIAEGVEQVV